MKTTAGQLFPESAHSAFLRLTGSRYDAMRIRIERKKLGPSLPFTKEQYRERMLYAMGAREDGFVQCCYCHGYFGIADIGSDHAVPLSRGGSLGLENIEFPCKRCNSQKGKLKPWEFRELLVFLQSKIPEGRMDVLDRLEKAVQHMAAENFNRATINDLKKSGQWQAAQLARKEQRKGSGKF